MYAPNVVAPRDAGWGLGSADFSNPTQGPPKCYSCAAGHTEQDRKRQAAQRSSRLAGIFEVSNEATRKTDGDQKRGRPKSQHAFTDSIHARSLTLWCPSTVPGNAAIPVLDGVAKRGKRRGMERASPRVQRWRDRTD